MISSLLSAIGSWIAQPAFASTIEQLGAGSPGIDAMWTDLKNLYPHTDQANAGLTFLTLLITNVILRFIGGIAVLLIMYGGIRMMMTVADENAHGEAKKIVMYACLGLVFVMSTDAIVLYFMRLVQLAAGG